jgi:hypothetical protein
MYCKFNIALLYHLSLERIKSQIRLFMDVTLVEYVKTRHSKSIIIFILRYFQL